MKYVLKYDADKFEKKFKNYESLENFLSEKNWSSNEIYHLMESKYRIGWSLETIPTNNREKFDLLWEEVERYKNSDHDGDLEFFVNNDFKLLAVDRWQSCGASQYDFSLKINKKEKQRELKEFYKISDHFTCESCGHIGFYQYDEEKLFIEYCLACGKKGKTMSYKNHEIIKEKLKDII